MTGVELALAIVPLIIALIEHHGSVVRKGKALARSKSKNEQQLDFYCELHDELSLLKITLDTITARAVAAGSQSSIQQPESITQVLGSAAPHFDSILNRVLKSISDIVSDKSVDLAGKDTVSMVNDRASSH